MQTPSTEIKVYRLFIKPQTKVNISDNEKWMFSDKITNQYLLKVGKKKAAAQKEAKAKRIIKEDFYVKRKQYVMKYFDYKRKVRSLFDKCGIDKFPTDNVWFKFFIPMPPSWSKKKRSQQCYQPHQSVSDASNLHKALEDACCDVDRKNWDYRASKFWHEVGFIEIHVGALPEAKGYVPYKKTDVLK